MANWQQSTPNIVQFLKNSRRKVEILRNLKLADPKNKQAYETELKGLLKDITDVDCRDQELKEVQEKFNLVFAVTSGLQLAYFVCYFADEGTELPVIFRDHDLAIKTALSECAVDRQIDFMQWAARSIEEYCFSVLSDGTCSRALARSLENVVRSRQETRFQVMFEIFDRKFRSLLVGLKRIVASDEGVFAKKQELARFISSERLKMHSAIRKL